MGDDHRLFVVLSISVLVKLHTVTTVMVHRQCLGQPRLLQTTQLRASVNSLLRRWLDMHGEDRFRHLAADFAQHLLEQREAFLTINADGLLLRVAFLPDGIAQIVHLRQGDGRRHEILVEPGQFVEAGETIALLGNRGQSTGPHLHFEVHQGGMNGKRIDPVPWLAARGVDV